MKILYFASSVSNLESLGLEREITSLQRRMAVAGGEPELRPEMGLGEEPDADLLPSAVGLVWRALVLWLLLILLLTFAYWAP